MKAITDHPDFLALMRTVIAHPDAALPRLVLADWLEGDAPTPMPEWAEFVEKWQNARNPRTKEPRHASK